MHGLLAQFAAERVVRELFDLLVRAMARPIGPAHRLQRLGHGAVEEPTARREQPAIRDLADPIVGEVQLVPHGLEHVLANHLLDRLCRVALVHAAGGSKQREVEPAPDDGSHRGQLLAPPAEPVEPLGHEIPHAGREGRRAGCSVSVRPPRLLVEGAHRLDGDKGVALAHGPDVLLHLGHRPSVGPHAGERAHEQRGVGA